MTVINRRAWISCKRDFVAHKARNVRIRRHHQKSRTAQYSKLHSRTELAFHHSPPVSTRIRSPGTILAVSIFTHLLFRITEEYSGTHSWYCSIDLVFRRQGRRQHSHAGAEMGGGMLLSPCNALDLLASSDVNPHLVDSK